jgi:hypothetical protein
MSLARFLGDRPKLSLETATVTSAESPRKPHLFKQTDYVSTHGRATSAFEAEMAIEKLKSHKSPGIDQIPAELD